MDTQTMWRVGGFLAVGIAVMACVVDDAELVLDEDVQAGETTQTMPDGTAGGILDGSKTKPEDIVPEKGNLCQGLATAGQAINGGYVMSNAAMHMLVFENAFSCPHLGEILAEAGAAGCLGQTCGEPVPESILTFLGASFADIEPTWISSGKHVLTVYAGKHLTLLAAASPKSMAKMAPLFGQGKLAFKGDAPDVLACCGTDCGSCVPGQCGGVIRVPGFADTSTRVCNCTESICDELAGKDCECYSACECAP